MSVHGRSRRALVLPLLVLTAVVGLAARPVVAERHGAVLPPVSLVVTLEVRDQTGWLSMEQEILGTMPESAKHVSITIPARSGGSRTITLMAPRFTAAIAGAAGTIIVVVTGRVAGEQALQTLPPFVHGLLESPAPSSAHKVSVEYGIAVLPANLVELRLVDR